MNDPQTDPDLLLDRVKQEFLDVTGQDWESQSLEENHDPQDKTIHLATRMNLFRDILLILSSSSKKYQDMKQVTSRNFSFLVSQETGLKTLLSATFDFDESSQIKTTIDQRCQASANIIAFIPVLCCPVNQYFDKISRQTFQLLLNEQSNASNDYTISCLRKISTFIVTSFIRRNKKLAFKYFIDPLIQSLSLDDSHHQLLLTVEESLEVIYSLISCHFDVKPFVGVFHIIFYARVTVLEGSSLKDKLTEIIKEIISKVDHSVYLLDDTLFNHFQTYFVVDEDGKVIRRKKKNEESASEVDFKRIDEVANFTLFLVTESFKEDDQLLDFVLLLLERLSFVRKNESSSLLLASMIISCLEEKIEGLVFKNPSKSIRFVSQSLSRNIHSHLPQESEESKLKIDTTMISLQILKQIIFHEKSSFSRTDIQDLKECLPGLQFLLSLNSLPKPLMKFDIIQVKQAIEDLDEDPVKKSSVKNEDSFFGQVMKDLNDPLMPTRAHALISLKRLIIDRDLLVVKNEDRILELLQASLSDPESYIYLSSINTLSELAVVSTDKVLPLLLETFSNDNRTIQERLNVGEVIVKVTRRLETDSCLKFTPQLMSFFSRNLLKEAEDDLIKVSCLSNLGSFCKQLGHHIIPFLEYIVRDVESLIQTDKSSLDVKRAAIMMFHLMLQGMDMETLMQCKSSVHKIHSIAYFVYHDHEDEISRLHAQLTLEQLDRITKDFLENPKTIKS